MNERYPLVANRREMGAARNDRDVVAARGKLCRDMAADRARAENTDLHLESLEL
jgi:hypothetical protein